MRFDAYTHTQGYTRTEVASDAASSPISYSVRTVRFGKLASKPREFRHRRGVSASDALKVASVGDQKFSHTANKTPHGCLGHAPQKNPKKS